MNAEIQAQLDRVETALTTLIDSITSYNPSPVAAVTLINADDALTDSLSHLAAHQANHTKLLALRATSAALDRQLKETLSLLAQTRNELLSLPLNTPATTQVDYRTLLNFAQRISRFTVPPTHRPSLPPALPLKEETDPPTNTRASAPPELPSQVPPSAIVHPDTPNGAGFPPTTPIVASAILPAAGGAAADFAPAIDPAVQAWLSPPSHARPFVPWPSEDRIRGGSLGVFQGMVVQGGEEGMVGTNGEQNSEDLIRRGVDVKTEGRVSPALMKARQSKAVGRIEASEGPQAKADVFDDLDLYNPEDEG